ncbi:MAG: radical SAM protein, partial [Coleofasciculus sp. S288]|nr:radical SAM protein [Coleofasciculus sp. S288]
MPENYVRTSYAVWEITLKCNLACSHCGSRAGNARPEELSTEEALDLVRQLAEVGIKEVTLIGGEAFMRPDWLTIAEAIAKSGMVCSMTTGGFGISLETAQRMKDAGIQTVSVSFDGMEETHDRLRGRKGSWKSALKTMSHFREVG